MLLLGQLSDLQVFALINNAVMTSMYTTLFEQLWLFRQKKKKRSKLSSKYAVPVNPPAEMPALPLLANAGYYQLKVDMFR